MGWLPCFQTLLAAAHPFGCTACRHFVIPVPGRRFARPEDELPRDSLSSSIPVHATPDLFLPASSAAWRSVRRLRAGWPVHLPFARPCALLILQLLKEAG